MAGTAYVAWMQRRGAREAAKENLVISREQGAPVMFKALHEALAAENTRLYVRIEQLESERDEWKTKYEGLAARSGTRADDPPG